MAKALRAQRASPLAKDTCPVASFREALPAPGQGCSKADERVTSAADLLLMEGRACVGASSFSFQMQGAKLRFPKVI